MTTTSTEQLSSIIETQLQSLDDTDCLASAWADALDAANQQARTSRGADVVKVVEDWLEEPFNHIMYLWKM